MGDSGALVVDAQTSVAYGHVVATSPRGEAYVVPLHATLCQVKALFGTDNVRLPEPLDMLSRMVLHYVTTEKFTKASVAIGAMMFILNRLQPSFPEERNRLTYWLKESTARTALLGLDSSQDVNRTIYRSGITIGYLLRTLANEDDMRYSNLDALEHKEEEAREALSGLDY